MTRQPQEAKGDAMLKLPNGEKAIFIQNVTEDLCPYCCADFPSGEYNGHELYINLQSGRLYALEG